MSQMTSAALKTQLKNFVQSMIDEGILDCHFSEIQSLQDASNPKFLDEVITMFCSDAHRIITELNKHLGYQNVDFSKLNSYVHQLKGSSSSIGAHRLKLDSTSLRQASEDRNKERCVRALHSITYQYCILHDKFQYMMQLERRIALQTNQR